MERYIALLRGVNVGGKNKVSMQELKTSLNENGFENVVTYINSGNVIFDSDSSDCGALQRIFNGIILSKFAIDVPVCVISIDDLENSLKNAPSWWGSDADSKHNAIFIIPPASAEEVIQKVGKIKSEFEKVYNHGNVIFWSAPVATFSKTSWSKIPSNPLVYNNITVRNSNTTKKLLELSK